MLATPGYCWFENDETAYKDVYGAYYNWYAVNTGILCPTSWHVPTDDDWTTLTIYLGGEIAAGGKMKETGTDHWVFPNTGATNVGGFTALPGSLRDIGGTFGSLGYNGIWWSATEYDSYVWMRSLSYDSIGIIRSRGQKEYGNNVRCILN
jgi:uncharacterized protein (TIGR02145 family)